MFIAALFTIAKTWKQSKYPSTDKWLKKRWYTHTHTHIHTHMEYESATENEIMPFIATWMDLEVIILSKSDKERWIPYAITYRWNLKKNDTNELIYKIEPDPQRKQTYCFQRGKMVGCGGDK